MTSIDICNLALGMLGIPRIASFDENNNHADFCKRFYPVLRDRCLRDHHWSFATAVAGLAITTDVSPDPLYPYICVAPVDLIRVQKIQGDRPYRIVGNRILVKEIPATLEYTRRIEDANLFDETFVEALQYLIAAEIGMVNTRDQNLITYYRQCYERAIALARSIDSQENMYSHQFPRKKSTFIAAHLAGCVPNDLPNTFVDGNAGAQQ